MQLIRCTKELQKRLELTKKNLQEYEPDEGLLGPWRANLIEVAGSPSMIFANDRTLLNFFIDINPEGAVRHFHKNFVAMLACVLADLGIPDKTREHILEEYSEIGFAPTNNRRVIGSMNDLASTTIISSQKRVASTVPIFPE